MFPAVHDARDVSRLDGQQRGALEPYAGEIKYCVHQRLQIVCWLRNGDLPALKLLQDSARSIVSSPAEGGRVGSSGYRGRPIDQQRLFFPRCFRYHYHYIIGTNIAMTQIRLHVGFLQARNKVGANGPHSCKSSKLSRRVAHRSCPKSCPGFVEGKKGRDIANRVRIELLESVGLHTIPSTALFLDEALVLQPEDSPVQSFSKYQSSMEFGVLGSAHTAT